MQDAAKTKERLIDEQNSLCRQVAEMHGAAETSGQRIAAPYDMPRSYIDNLLPIGLITWEEGRFVDVSDNFLQLMGFQREKVIGHTWQETGFVTAEQWSFLLREFNEKGKIENIEMQVKVKDGTPKLGLLNAALLNIDDRKYLWTVMVGIMERRQAEAALQESEERYRTLFEKAIDGILLMTFEGRIVNVNRSFAEMHGYTVEELLQMEIGQLDVMKEQTMSGHVERMNDLLAGKDLHFEVEHYRKDGHVITLSVATNRVAIGRRNYILAFHRDITALQKFTDAVQESERKYRLLVENLNEGIWQIDEDAFTCFANQHMADMLGYEVGEMLGKHLFEFMDEQGAAIARQNLAQRRSGVKEQHGFEFLRRDGARIYASLVTAPIMDEEGNYRGAIAGVHDVSDAIRVEEELERHRKHLEDMIHERTVELEAKTLTLQELNTTLKVLLKQREDDKKDLEERFVLNIRNLVLPYVEQMKKKNLDAEQKAYLDIIETHLYEIATPMLKNIRQFNLTPKEVRVASLVKAGKTTKEIAGIMGIATGSIDIHRKNLRKKLGLQSRKSNLATHLESLNQ